MATADSHRPRLDPRRLRLPARPAAADPAAVSAHEPHRLRRVHHLHRADFRHLRILRRPARRSLRPRPHHRRMPRLRHRPALLERADHQHSDLRDPPLADGSSGRPDCRRRRRFDSRHVAAPQPRARIRTADHRPRRRELPLQLRRRSDAADLSHLAIANLDHGILRRRDVRPHRDLALRSKPRAAHADHED